MKFLLTLTAAILATSAATAQSTDGGFIDIETIEVQEEAPVNDWSGFYAGGSIGSINASVGDLESERRTTGGLQFGYNWSRDNFVFGAEGALDAIDGVDRSVFVYRAVARAGFTNENTLFYSSLGAARLSDGYDSDTYTTIGLGLDYMATSDIIVGGEFIRIDAGDVTFVNPNGSLSVEDLYLDQLRFRVNYKF